MGTKRMNEKMLYRCRQNINRRKLITCPRCGKRVKKLIPVICGYGEYAAHTSGCENCENEQVNHYSLWLGDSTK